VFIMSRKKDKKKSGKSKDKIELHEISAEEAVQTPAPQKKTSGKKTSDAETVEAKPVCKVQILPALNGKTVKNYEETTAATLNATVAEGYELLCVVPSADAKNLVAFFRLSK
jgi:hypothetical protein